VLNPGGHLDRLPRLNVRADLDDQLGVAIDPL
jgi:hypothetical protein